jgi:hypothetical protein
VPVGAVGTVGRGPTAHRKIREKREKRKREKERERE